MIQAVVQIISRMTETLQIRQFPRKHDVKNMFSGVFCFLAGFCLTFFFLCYKIFYICTPHGWKSKGSRQHCI